MYQHRLLDPLKGNHFISASRLSHIEPLPKNASVLKLKPEGSAMKVKCLIIFLISLHNTLSIHHAPDKRFAESESVLDPKGEMTLKWRVDYLEKKVRLRVEFSDKAPSLNWFALGFSDRGSLEKSDVCLVWTDYKGKDHFEDMHADENGKLIRDRHQDCNDFYVNAKTRTINFERDFDTCSDDDYVIEDGTVHIIWSRGTDKLFSSNRLCISCTSAEDHGFIRVRLLTIPGTSQISQAHAAELRLTTENVKVPNSDTTYWCKVFKLPEFVATTAHHIVKFGSIITKGNEGLVHHMEVFYCDAEPNAVIPMYEGNCFATERPEKTKLCSKVKAAWAMGAPPFVYPKEAGLPFGGPTSNKFVMLEVHYNNPEKGDDWVDSSGILLTITANKRQYDAAIMELGLEYTDKMAIPGGQKAFPLTGYCIPQCTGVGLPASGITVFGSQLHTHLTGAAVWTRHARAGLELPRLNTDLHYSTHFQEIRLLHHPVEILPGDYLETTCIYNTEDKSNATVGGHAITDEMCVNYIHYYPATQLEVCKSAVSNKALEDYFKFEKQWDNMSISFTSPPRANYLSISPWTPLRANALSELYNESPISMQCNKSDGNRFQGDWEGIHVPKIKLPLLEKPRSCPNKYLYTIKK